VRGSTQAGSSRSQELRFEANAVDFLLSMPPPSIKDRMRREEWNLKRTQQQLAHEHEVVEWWQRNLAQIHTRFPGLNKTLLHIPSILTWMQSWTDAARLGSHPFEPEMYILHKQEAEMHVPGLYDRLLHDLCDLSIRPIGEHDVWKPNYSFCVLENEDDCNGGLRFPPQQLALLLGHQSAFEEQLRCINQFHMNPQQLLLRARVRWLLVGRHSYDLWRRDAHTAQSVGIAVPDPPKLTQDEILEIKLDELAPGGDEGATDAVLSSNVHTLVLGIGFVPLLTKHRHKAALSYNPLALLQLLEQGLRLNG
jgi:hypothetical protein